MTVFRLPLPGHSPRSSLQGSVSVAPASSVEQSAPLLAGAGLLQALALFKVPSQVSWLQAPKPQGPQLPFTSCKETKEYSVRKQFPQTAVW